MKKDKRKKLQQIAEKIIAIEKEIQEKNVPLDKLDLSYGQKIDNLIHGLSLYDLIEIDNYIMKKKLLTK